MIPNELSDNPKLLRLRRAIRARISGWQDATPDQLHSLMLWIDQSIAEWSREERRRRKARKRHK